VALLALPFAAVYVLLDLPLTVLLVVVVFLALAAQQR